WIIEQILIARNVGAQLLLKAGQRSVALGGRREIVCTVEEQCRSHQRAQLRSARGNGLTARLPPAESPPIAIRRPSPFHRRALSAAHPMANIVSSNAAGNGCSRPVDSRG